MIGSRLLFVHHANQFLITDGYDNRDGISSIADGYERILRRHDELGVPAGLHLSGTLLEALAWYRPQFIDLVKRLIEKGVLTPIGGTYADNVMTEWPADFNRRQLLELFALYDDLFDFPPDAVTTFWLPERVWDERLADVLRDKTLPNNGYRAVLLDDRLQFSPDPEYRNSARERFDATGPYGGAGARDASTLEDASAGPYRIVGSDLLAIPISADLRYWVPPRSPIEWTRIKRRFAASSGKLLVFADDLERTAGVGGWEGDGRPFCKLLEWVAADSTVTPQSVDGLLAESVDVPEARVRRGTFFELEQMWGAGDDYRGWTGGAAWAPYKRIYDRVLHAVCGADHSDADQRLVELAWKHLLASSHETGWHDPIEGETRRFPAPWTKALASHSRAALVMVDAAHRLSAASIATFEIEDVDEDGDREVVLYNGECYAMITPRFGARLLYMIHRSSDGCAMSMGNPTDHWNFQQSLNRHMERPPNHPCGLTDAGGENDHYDIRHIQAADATACVSLENVGAGPLRGLRKSYILMDSPPGIVVCYRNPGDCDVTTQLCLSPDYLSLLRCGRRKLRVHHGRAWTSISNGDVNVWFGSDVDDGTMNVVTTPHDVGHGITHALSCGTSHFHIAIAWGEVDDDVCHALLGEGSRRVHSLLGPTEEHELEAVV